jgi:hypothetical protein
LSLDETGKDKVKYVGGRYERGVGVGLVSSSSF